MTPVLKTGWNALWTGEAGVFGFFMPRSLISAILLLKIPCAQAAADYQRGFFE
jgi:hypothetical protein